MSERIANLLINLFKNHRIVFWYDSKLELRDDFDALDLPDVEKIILDNNEFGLKHQVLRAAPKQKFLLYREGVEPEPLENWLLDVQLANTVFRTDQVSIWLSDLGIGTEYSEVIREHAPFFQAKNRKQALKQLLKDSDSMGIMRLKMCAVCAKSEPRLDLIVETLLQELASGGDEKVQMIKKYHLDEFLWQQMYRHYGYESEAPGIRDFAIELFKSCYAMSTEGEVKLTGDALVFFKRWKNNIQQKDSFECLSAEFVDYLGVKQDLNKRDIEHIIELDYFELIDLKIIDSLIRGVLSSEITSFKVSQWIRQRHQQSHWYAQFKDIYESIDYAAQFMYELSQVKYEMNSFSEGVIRYSEIWFKLDQLYRKYIYHMLKANQPTLLNKMTEKVENFYSNNYLLDLNNRFQSFVDTTAKWEATSIPLQNTFYHRFVSPFLASNNKVYVIISDALRYEVADELMRLIRQEDRFDAELEPMLSMLPSYTQLGMASLLPHKQLSFAEDGSGTVLVDSISTKGSDSRNKILNGALAGRGSAVTAENFIKLNRDDSRDLLKANDVIYIYHNRIDHTGDKIQSEGDAFIAAQETIDELIQLIKKLVNANANNILITADHGFIYQNRKIDDSDFSATTPSGEVLNINRRFVLGRNLKDLPSLRKFSSAQLGLLGDIEVQIPKSINRLRVRGSGSRFVHGGAALQEIVIPLLKVNKKRQSDISSVDVEILRGSNSIITSSELSVGFYQSTPVTDKVRPRILRLGVYAGSGELISDTHELTFDYSSENARNREQHVTLLLTREADDYNNQEVLLKLEEKLKDTSHYTEYKSLSYVVRRSFDSNFDF